MLKADNFNRVNTALHKINEFRKIHYIELLIFVFYLAQGLRASANFSLLYSKVCRELHSANPTVCEQLKSDKSAENAVQNATARWLLFMELIMFLPNLLMAMFFGSYGDKYGRKAPSLVAIASQVAHNFLYMLFVTMDTVPVYALVIESGIIAFFGAKTVFLAAQFADASDQTKDKEKLTQRFSILTACTSCGVFVAGNLSPFLLENFPLQWSIVVGESVMFLAFVFALCNRCPETEEQRKRRLSRVCSTITDDAQLSTTASFAKFYPVLSRIELSSKPTTISTERFDPNPDRCQWFRHMQILYKNAWHVLSRQRANRGRCHLLAFCFVGLVYACADSGMDIVTALFVFKDPISWTPAIFSRWMATVSVVQLIGGIVGTLVLKRLHFSDHTLLLVGLTSTVLKMATISVATKTWMMFLATALGCLSTVGASSVRSLVVHLGTGEETGELTSMLSIVMGWSQLTGSLVCNNIYTATLNYFAGFTFAVVAALLVLCLALVIFVMHDVKKCKFEQRTPTEFIARETARIVFILIVPTL